MMQYMGALSVASTTYNILTKANTLSGKIQELIHQSELSHQDQLNFRALERRLVMLQEPLSYLLILKQNQEIAQQKFVDGLKKQQQQEIKRNGNVDRKLENDKISQFEMNSIDLKPITMASEFLNEINEFIQKLMQAQQSDSTKSSSEQTNNILDKQSTLLNNSQTLIHKFNKNFSVELKHYVDEIQQVINSLQFALSVRQMRQNNQNEKSNLEQKGQIEQMLAPIPSPNGFSLSTFLKASHRLRSMCLVSGFVLQRYGRFKAHVLSKQIIRSPSAANMGGEGLLNPSQLEEKVIVQGQKWIRIIDNCELKIRYSLRRKMFILEVNSLDSHSQSQQDLNMSSASVDTAPRYLQQPAKKQKFAFEMGYSLNSYTTQSSRQEKENKRIDAEVQNLRINGQNQHLQSVLEQLKPNDTILWTNINGDEYSLGQSAQSQRQDGLAHLTQHTLNVQEITHFGFTQSSEYDREMSLLDILYLLKLCQYENEQVRLDKLRALQLQGEADQQQKYVAFKDQTMHPQVPQIIKDNQLGALTGQLNRQSGINIGAGRVNYNVDANIELFQQNHGLAHLNATDDELQELFSIV